MVKNQLITEEYSLYLGDSGEVLQSFPNKTIHLSVYSPPFGGLYHYSSDNRDLSNADNYEQFFQHYEFIIKELARITIPGRITAVHCTDIPSGNTGCDYMIDFPGDIIRSHNKLGWKYLARYCVWKEPLGVRLRTMAKNLAHKTIVDDSSKCTNAAADYLLIFRRDGDNPIPIKNPNGLLYYAGEREIPKELLKYKNYQGNQIENLYSHWIWRQYASAFWDDIRLRNILEFKPSRDDKDEKHVHPLQLDVIDRCVILWSNKKEIVLTPFMGVGSEIYSAVSLDRKGIGIELKESYYNQSIKNLLNIEKRFKDEKQLSILKNTIEE